MSKQQGAAYGSLPEKGWEDVADWAARIAKVETPELRLAAAIMGEAITDLRRGPMQCRPEMLGSYEDARRWVESDIVWACSFVGLCNLFDLDVELTRAALLAIVPDPSARALGTLRNYVHQQPRASLQRPNSRRPSWRNGDLYV